MSYLDALYSFLPRGLLWRKRDGSSLDGLLSGHAVELDYVDGSAQNLMAEINPTTTIEALEDWERVADLPYCDLSSDTVTERRAHLLARLLRPCGQNTEYFANLAKTLGYDDPVVTTYTPFCADVSGADEDVCDGVGGGYVDYTTSPPTIAVSDYDGWLNAWKLSVSGQPIYHFCADDCGADDAISWWGDGQLECVIRAAAPAHSVVIFMYND